MKVNNIINFYESSLNTPYQSFSGATSTDSMQDKVVQIDTFWNSNKMVSKKTSEMLKENGNKYFKEQNYKKAIESYKKAVEIKPDYPDVYFNLGRSYRYLGDIPNAINSYEKLIKLNPDDLESLCNLADCYKLNGDFNTAEKTYKKVIAEDEKYDLAQRKLKQLENEKLAISNPFLAKKEKNDAAKKNMEEAKNLAFQYFPKETVDDVRDIAFVFDKTDTLGGQSNIAQYENNNRRIVVTDDYTWANPKIIASYLVHEIIHAKDRDCLTSITEEQDAYRESVKFWLINNDNVKDPEMDYASNLYKQNRSLLDEKVAQTYSTKDGSIPEFSPNHGIAAFSLKNFYLKTTSLFSGILHPQNNPKNTIIISENPLMQQACR
ncbi:MAG: tetratricopeptide repeat protein [Candidatus Gastranaerophilales bacterium]|nr:tetratricopeptide repeat protein [Candidatus Gastranaerophilales bacterium]